MKANAASVLTSTEEHFVLSALTGIDSGNSGVILDGPDDVGNDFGITLGNSGVILDEPDENRPSTAFISNDFKVFSGGKVPTFIDSGASDTMFVSRNDFIEYTPITSHTGDSAKAKGGDFAILGEGKVKQWYLVEGQEKAITYTRALHTPALSVNHISMSAFDKAGLTTTFGGGHGVIRKGDGSIVLTGRGEKSMYIVDTVGNRPSMAMSSLLRPTLLEQWHHRLTHCSPTTIQEMVNYGLVDGLAILGKNLQGKCEDCILGRQTHCPFDERSDPSVAPLDLVSFDLWGPSCTQSAGGKVYFMPIVDAGTSYKHGAYLPDKSNVAMIAAFNNFCIKAESLTGWKIWRLHTDRAYESMAWATYCWEHSILYEFTAPYSSAQNGLAEHAIRTTMDDVRTLLHDSGLGHSYWAEAAAYSIETHNLIPSH